MSDEDTLVRGRSKRSTAGNRMEAALAEIANEQLPLDADDDRDFVGPDDEEEIFDSDFVSTDEEEAQEDIEEKAAQEEEKREHRTVRQRVAKAVEAASQRHRTAFNIPAQSQPTEVKTRPTGRGRRRVSLGVAIDVETGEVVDAASKRKSRRKSTVLNSQQMHSRMKDAEIKRAATPKKIKEVTRTLTQAELIARALDTEEVNIIEHRDYLKQEEEKRRQARVVRKTVTGPLVRWVSRTEHERPVVEEVRSTLSTGGVQTTTNSVNAGAPLLGSSNSSIFYMNQPTSSAQASIASAPGTSDGIIVPPPPSYSTSLSFPFRPSPSQSFIASVANDAKLTPTALPPAPPAPTPAPEPDPVPVTKCYAVHELGQQDGVPKPKWEDTMTALFGDHVKWSEMKVYSSKNRPLSRPVQRCPITGSTAPYRDPRTMVPFANVEGYKTLTKILEHKLVWSAELGCYTMNEDDFEAMDLS